MTTVKKKYTVPLNAYRNHLTREQKQMITQELENKSIQTFFARLSRFFSKNPYGQTLSDQVSTVLEQILPNDKNLRRYAMKIQKIYGYAMIKASETNGTINLPLCTFPSRTLSITNLPYNLYIKLNNTLVIGYMFDLNEDNNKDLSSLQSLTFEGGNVKKVIDYIYNAIRGKDC